MKILYLSCHEVLEYDELCLLTELEGLDIEVFSMGAFSNPTQGGGFMRSVIPKGRFYPQLYNVAMQCSPEHVHPELLEWADVVLSMHNSRIPGQKHEQPWLRLNWNTFAEHQVHVVWRSIGQSVPGIERELKVLVDNGLKIVRYSPCEKHIPDYVGESAMIRFYKDPEEFSGWTGEKARVMTIAQSFKRRGEHCGYAWFERVTEGFPRIVYGTENQDLGELNGGNRTYSELKQNLCENRVFIYFGTQPASYTLSFIEAWMTGIPIVSVGKYKRHTGAYPGMENVFEVPDLIENGVNGFVSDDFGELREYIHLLLDDHDLAKQVGGAGRQSAIEHFGKEKIMGEWKEFLGGLV